MMICYEVRTDDGIWSSKQSTISFNQFSGTFNLDSEPIKIDLPIGVQKFSNYFYIFWSTEIITAVGIQNWDSFSSLLQSHRIPFLKTPEKNTQILAMETQAENIKVHCGTYNFEHDCFIIATKNQVQIRNREGKQLCKQYNVIFDDSERKVTVGQGYFYFWKDMEYAQFKQFTLAHEKNEKPIIEERNLQIVDTIQMQPMDEQCENEPMCQCIEEKQEEAENVCNQNIDLASYKKNDIMIDEKEQKTTKKLREVIEQAPITERKDQARLRNKQMKSTQAKQQKFEYIDNPFDAEPQEAQKVPRNMRISQMVEPIEPQGNIQERQLSPRSRFQDSAINHSSVTPLLDSHIIRHMINYNASSYQVDLCCLNGYDVIDIRTNSEKQFLYYNRFQTTNQAASTLLCELKFEEEGQIGLVRSSKLLYDPEVQAVFYNDLDRGYIHEYSLKNRRQESYPVRKPIKDMVLNNNGSILCVNQNEIFKFDTKTQKIKFVARYKTVNNLCKISNIFRQFYYAVASGDGNVRTYDIRTSLKGKALNKFRMPKGITSLQVSNQGSFILCKYGHKAQILCCKDENQNSVFESRIRMNDRKSAKNLVREHEKLSHIQFLKQSSNQGDFIAVDDQNPCRIVIKNIEKGSKTEEIKMQKVCNEVQFMKCCQNWIIYGVQGVYYKQSLSLH